MRNTLETNKNVHVVAFKTPASPDVQLGVFINDNQVTSLNMAQGTQILNTAVLSGSKVLDALSPTEGVKTPLVAPQEATERVLEENIVEKKKSLEEMITHTRYLVEEYGTANEKRYINKFLIKVV